MKRRQPCPPSKPRYVVGLRAACSGGMASGQIEDARTIASRNGTWALDSHASIACDGSHDQHES